MGMERGGGGIVRRLVRNMPGTTPQAELGPLLRACPTNRPGIYVVPASSRECNTGELVIAACHESRDGVHTLALCIREQTKEKDEGPFDWPLSCKVAEPGGTKWGSYCGDASVWMPPAFSGDLASCESCVSTRLSQLTAFFATSLPFICTEAQR